MSVDRTTIMKIFDEIYENRNLIGAMVERNIRGRYGNSCIGIWWNLISPILLIIAVYVIFTSVKQISVDKDYWVYLSCGIFAMTFCMYCFRGRSLLNNRNYVKKMAMPKWVPVLADVLTQFVLLLISYVIMIAGILIMGFPVNGMTMLFLPLELILLFIFCYGLSLVFSVLSVIYGDVGYLLSSLSRVIIWITPTFFKLDSVNDTLKMVSYYNPFTYFVETFHQIIYFGSVPSTTLIVGSVLISFAGFFLGAAVLRIYGERTAEML